MTEFEQAERIVVSAEGLEPFSYCSGSIEFKPAALQWIPPALSRRPSVTSENILVGKRTNHI